MERIYATKLNAQITVPKTFAQSQIMFNSVNVIFSIGF
jgi:hypothetical protein